METPILQPIYGGAAAQPFITHHNQLKQDLYLRISFELYLKRLLVGGLERVYEIGRDFRNEGVSLQTQPGVHPAGVLLGLRRLPAGDGADRADGGLCRRPGAWDAARSPSRAKRSDLNPPWRRLDLRQGLIETAGIDIAEHPTAESLAAAMRRRGLEPNPGLPRGKLIDGLLSDYLEPTLIQPTFLYDYPRDISPLAKSKPGDPSTVERFEGFVAGMELCNAFTELNDPLDQEARFLEMGRDYAADDEERHPMDEDYLRAMRYGMPPNGGFGMGVDRLVMLLTEKHQHPRGDPLPAPANPG